MFCKLQKKYIYILYLKYYILLSFRLKISQWNACNTDFVVWPLYSVIVALSYKCHDLLFCYNLLLLHSCYDLLSFSTNTAFIPIFVVLSARLSWYNGHLGTYLFYSASFDIERTKHVLCEIVGFHLGRGRQHEACQRRGGRPIFWGLR